ncbi:Hypothetical predicted protein [Paramuricea clavata]|uniref:Uncharacterized protein n=1 Tax=Paramuricea clavata TaxID=317549 RepID=A0A7D9JTC7_PARCT|nr:Hypothetical predicted protein [Paramuricea clavata]
MPRAYSQDLRWRAFCLTEIMGFHMDEVSILLQMSKKMISRYIWKFRMLGHVDTAVIGRPYACIAMRTRSLLSWKFYCSTQNEHYLKRNNITRKKLAIIARQRCENAREEFRAATGFFSVDMFVFLDKSGYDKRLLRSYGYNLKGRRARIRRRYLPLGPRITAIPIICNEGLLDVAMYEGHVNGETFLEFVNDVLIPCLVLFDGFNPRSIVILDNAAIHHTEDVVDAINATVALLIFLPPYSPDFRPWEELFSQSKNYIRQNDVAWQDSPDPALMVFDSFLQVTDGEIQINYIRHAEYA